MPIALIKGSEEKQMYGKWLYKFVLQNDRFMLKVHPSCPAQVKQVNGLSILPKFKNIDDNLNHGKFIYLD